MQPYLNGQGEPVGQRKRKRRKITDNLKKLPLPSPLINCLCSDCVAYPQTHPEGLFPGEGRWLSKKEWKKHSNEERKRGVARTLLGQLEPPALRLPIPGEFGLLPSPVAPPQPVHEPISQAPLLPIQSPSPQDIMSNEVAALLMLVRPALDVFSDQVVIFRHPPNFKKVDPSLLDADELAQICSLDQTARSNSTLLGYSETLERAQQWSEAHPIQKNESTHLRLQKKLLQKRATLERQNFKSLLLAEWQHQARIADLACSFDSTRYFRDKFRLLPPLVLMAYLLVASLHLLCGVSIDHCGWTLEVLKLIVTEALKKSTDVFAPHTPDAFRGDVRSVIDILDLGPRFKAYISCPKCCHLYGFDPDNPSSCPDVCTNREFAHEPICGAKLRRVRSRNGRIVKQPIREYHHRSMKDYVAHLFSRPDLQQYLYTDPTACHPSAPDTWDVWDAPCLRDFRGPDGVSPFVKDCGNEGRLIFSLNMDGFNPLGNKESGKKVSIGGMYMICLNLPPAIRYNLENIYLVGIIPGPKEPSLHQINYYLKPLVDDLLEFWSPGVFLSRTAKHVHGWLVRCAIVPLVCDLPAARQMSGAASYTSHQFCSQCTQVLDNIQNLEPDKWTPRTQASHRASAAAWLHLQTPKERAKHVKETGVRWSELLRLPYWDPVRFTIIDSMHAFYLRLFQHHCRNLWGMNVAVNDGTALISSGAVHPPEDEMKRAHQTLRYGGITRLKALSVHVIRQLCRDIGSISHHGKKGGLVQRLLEYRIQQGWFDKKGALIDDRSTDQEMPDVTPSSILVAPEIQTYIKQGKVPPALLLQTPYDAEDFYRNAEKPAVQTLKKEDLQTLFLLKVQPILNLDLAAVKGLNVAQFRDYIQKQRMADGFIDDKGRPSWKPVQTKRTVVLGTNVLAEVRKDTERLHFPSWMARAPNNPGSESRGKFSADQWRTFCMYILPVTLIRLWGQKPEDSIERRQLDNFMHLVSAVKIATMRKITEQKIVEYERHMLAYLTTLQTLYPDAEITPYQHLSLHFGSFLRDFGPTHAWRCFPFERYNFVMQNMPTNHIYGEMERTLFHKFSCAQRLRSFFTVEALPSAVRPLVDAFNRAFKNDGRGTYLNDILAHHELRGQPGEEKSGSQTLSLSQATKQLLSSWVQKHDNLMGGMAIQNRAVLHSQIERFGHKFSTMEHSVSDSQIVVDGFEDTHWSAGVIQQLFSHTRTRSDQTTVTQTFALIALYNPLTTPGADPYHQYPVAGGRLFANTFQKKLVLIDSSMIKAHFASILQDINGQESLLALPLDKH